MGVVLLAVRAPSLAPPPGRELFAYVILAGSVLDFEVLDASNVDFTDSKSSALKA